MEKIYILGANDTPIAAFTDEQVAVNTQVGLMDQEERNRPVIGFNRRRVYYWVAAVPLNPEKVEPK